MPGDWVARVAFLFFVQVAYSQQVSPALPHELAPAEECLVPQYRATRATQAPGIATPPPFAVRAAAEWEEIQALYVTWTSYISTLAEVVRYAQDECKVIIHCTDSNAVKTDLITYSVPNTNIAFVQVPFNTIWLRDYGANTVYANGVDSLALVDWIYNRPRPKDDTVPIADAAAMGIQLYSTSTPPYDLVNTGGNFMCDGQGTAFASKLILSYKAAQLHHYLSELISMRKQFLVRRSIPLRFAMK